MIAGMIIAQVFFTGFVYSSNGHLHKNLIAMQEAEYQLLVPNKLVMPTLLEWKPAFCGGLFFTLTIGAGLSFTGWLTVFLWRAFPKHRPFTFSAFLLFGGYMLFRLNDHGMNLPVTFICAVIPAVAGLAAHQFYAKLPNTAIGDYKIALLHIMVIAIIAIIWMPKASNDVFTTIRDHLLLTSSLGQKINDFYYRYTLYPAESFKTLDQKMLKTVSISAPDNNLEQRLENRLRAEDYLPVDTHPADLMVTQEDNHLIFKTRSRIVHTTTVSDFLKAPSRHLDTVSKNSDRKHFFRKMTFISLIIISPLLCYILLHAIFTMLLFFIPSASVRSACAALVCLVAGGMAALPVYHDMAGDITPFGMKRYLDSNRWQDRVSALKYLANEDVSEEIAENIAMDETGNLFRLTTSPWIAERYWLAKAAGNSPLLTSKHIALRLLEDDQPNVACMALYSLGKQGDTTVIPLIIDHIKESTHWYVQWYAYKAIKRLGWKQPAVWKPY